MKLQDNGRFVNSNINCNELYNCDILLKSLEDKLDLEEIPEPNLSDIIDDIFVVMQRCLHKVIITLDIPVSTNGPFGTTTPSNCYQSRGALLPMPFTECMSAGNRFA